MLDDLDDLLTHLGTLDGRLPELQRPRDKVGIDMETGRAVPSYATHSP